MTTSPWRLLALTGVLLLPTACEEPPPPQEELLRPVRWVPARLSDGQRERTFSGSARASTESVLSFKVAGTIQDLPVQVGDQVAAGQLIAQLDPRDYELQVQEANASLVDAEAQAREAASNYDRYRLLYEADNTSKSEFDAARAADESATAAVTASRKRLEIAELQLGYTRLEAPMDGAIADRPVEVNENVNAGTSIVQLTSGGLIEVEIVVPEVLITQVETGSRCVAAFDALPGREFAATVTEVGVASLGQATFPVKVRLFEEVDEVRPGMAAVVRLRLDDTDDRPRAMIPAVAVGEDTHGRFVFVAEDDGPDRGVVERRAVEVGDLTAGGELEIFDGLVDGDRVVIRGMSKLQHGMSILLPESGAAD